VQPDSAKSKKSKEQELIELKVAIDSVGQDLSFSIAKHEGTVLGEILSAMKTIAEDPALVETAEESLSEGWDSPTAIVSAIEVFAELLQDTEGFAERIADIRELGLRISAKLTGQDWKTEIPEVGRLIIVAEDLSPSETSEFTSAVIGVITQKGGPTSHTAIICRQKGIPALVSCSEALSLDSGARIMIDPVGDRAVVDGEISSATQMLREFKRTHAPLVQVMGNVGSIEDANSLQETEASGVGLLRTELLFLNRDAAPSLAEQTKLYSELLSSIPAGEVIFRTLDAGSDKPLKFMNLGQEENPALGVRGFRMHAKNPGVLLDQLTAILDAGKATGREVSVMAPMIALASEAKEFTNLAREVGHTRVGVMVETPSMAMDIAGLKGVVDFVSLGTNDLSQYLFAADRQNDGVASLLDPWQPSLIRMINKVVQDAHPLGIKVGICGESASDPYLSAVFAGIGVDSLSMAATSVDTVGNLLGSIDIELAESCSRAALVAQSATGAKQAVIALLAG
jgi:phosphotransferase system enzyme I (PtsI)